MSKETIANRPAGIRLRPVLSGDGRVRCLLSTTALIAVTAMATPVLGQDCEVNGDNCNISGNGADGSDAPLDGGTGGGGQGGPSWVWQFDNVNYTELDTAIGSISPLNVNSMGGNGAQGSDGHSSDRPGGSGGIGGDGGPITVWAGPGSSGTITGVASGMTLSSTGGIGGGGAFGAIGASAGASGAGGDGGTITATILGIWPINTGNASGRAIDIWSLGGAGGQGRGWSAGQDTSAPDGGTGGNGQQIDVTLGGTFQSWRGGVRIQSVGGAGGEGGDDTGASSPQGGKGGTGGNGGGVAVTVNAGTSIQQELSQDAGLWIVSNGGAGGNGGPGGDGGAGGAGGNAQDVTLTLNGGVVNAGGNANIKSGNWSVSNPTSANMAPAVLAQSIGGGGGGGRDAGGWFAVGGSGGTAIAGGNAGVSLSNSVITAYSGNSDGIAVQSIGGGGGKGGDAQGSGTLVNMLIGGTGGAGGNGGIVNVNSGDGNTIETTGVHSHGVLGQSIGGGGGMGGAAYSKAVSAAFGASMSLGGTGGDGGDVLQLTVGNNTPVPTNSGRIRSMAQDSLEAQICLLSCCS